MVSRRGLLALTGTLVAGAGCSQVSEESGPQVVCQAGILAGGGDVVFRLTPQVSSYGQEPPLTVLTVPVRQSVLAEEGIDVLRIVVSGADSYEVPVDPVNDEPVGDVQRYDSDDVVEYAQTLGPVPYNGRVRMTAVSEGSVVDELRLEFRCYRRNDEPSG